MDTEFRNELVVNYSGFVWQAIRRNRALLIALRIDEDDAFQDLMLVLIKAIPKFDSERCDCLDKYVNAKLRFGVLDMKREYKAYGIVGGKARPLAFVSGDAALSDTEYFVSGSETYLEELDDAFKTLTPLERTTVQKVCAGFPVHSKTEKKSLESGRAKLRAYFMDDLGAEEKCRRVTRLPVAA